jgi:hypothetical protein
MVQASSAAADEAIDFLQVHDPWVSARVLAPAVEVIVEGSSSCCSPGGALPLRDPWSSWRAPSSPSHRSSPAVAVEDSEVGANLRGEWVACPAGHRLIYMRVDDDYSCNVCANTVSFAFGCRVCEFDVCGNCKLSGDPVRNVHDSMPPGKANGP